MGYDMSIVGEIQPVEDLKYLEKRMNELKEIAEATGVDYFTAMYKNDKENPVDPDVRAAWEAADAAREDYYDAASPGYFRLNIWGMERYRQAMAEAGMASEGTYYDEESKVKWPDYPEDADEDSEAMKAYEAAVAPILQARPGVEHGIAMHKFGSNDGWWVTPEEIDEALEAWEKFSENGTRVFPEDVVFGQEYWRKWIGYLKLARSHGGFRVY